MMITLITIIILGLCIAGIKLLVKKDGEFAGTCASQNPLLNESNEPCGFCGKTPDQFKDCDVKN